MMTPLPTGRAALVVAHPGHELRVYGWLETARPRVFVLTDGSGRSGRSRLQSTTNILADAGSDYGSLYGRFTDRTIYEALLHQDHQLFTDLARELADEFLRERIEYVAGDAIEGYSSSHDVCRMVLDAAVALAKRDGASRLGNYDFLLKGRPDECPAHLHDQSIWLGLDDDTVERKLKAAANYPELASEVETAIRENGSSAFRVECLRPVEDDSSERFAAEKPYYEQYGEQQVAAGHYQNVIRYREHMLPLAEALRKSHTGDG
jgi:hypothetical protein